MPDFIPCSHTDILTDVSSNALEVEFSRPGSPQRAAATTLHGQVKTALAQGIRAGHPSTFPAPLVLPDDDLSIDPKYPAQSVRSWKTPMQRADKAEPHRRTIYFAAAPGCAPDATFVKDWAAVKEANGRSAWRSAPESLFEGTFEYLKAFYHGMQVKKLDSHLRFVNVGTPPKPKSRKGEKGKGKAKMTGDVQIGLEFTTPSSPTDRYVLDIRSRISPHEAEPTYPRQLNLNDLIDAAIAMLPADAYALLLLLDHDIYEDDDDDFACGRAYGGSRVAVVSAARYNPVLDDRAEGLDREHSWPASHCAEFVRGKCGEGRPAKKKARKGVAVKKSVHKDVRTDEPDETGASSGPLGRAVRAYSAAWLASDGPSKTMSMDAQARLWLARVCKTASHEVGHCVGIDHCVYYACIMQGTAGLAEDARQPPYLCPVDLAKVLQATGGDERERYRALLTLSEKDNWIGEPMFAAYAQWIRGVLDEMDLLTGKSTPREVIVVD